MIREIQAKTMLARVNWPGAWFGIRYNMNLYRGCQHRCIYCDSRSQCYGIDAFDKEVLVKANALDLLRDELPRKRVKGVVGTGSMNDPYGPVESERRLMRGALELFARYGFGVHITTKSDLVLRDLALLQEVGGASAAGGGAASVLMTITTTDDAMAAIVEPLAPSPSRRLRAVAALAEAGIPVGVTMMPILPFIEDTEENVTAIVARAAEAGARCLIPGYGLTMRDRQRAYYYRQLDRHFPGLRARYERAYGERYHCPPPNAARLDHLVKTLCQRHGLSMEARHELPEQRALPWS